MILLFFLCTVLWVVWTLYKPFAYRHRSFEGRTVLVTGACSDVGRCVCAQLYAQGASLVAWDVSKSRLDDLRRDITGDGEGPVDSGSGGSARTTSTLSARSGVGSPRLTSVGSPVPSQLQRSSSSADGDTVGATSPTAKEGWTRRRSFPPQTFDVTMVDLSSRMQIQRAVKELIATTTTVTSPTISGGSRAGVDFVFNLGHFYPTKPMAERTEDTLERTVLTNTLTPLLLARQLCPLMMERKEGGGFVSFVASVGDGAAVLDAASPDYAASQWGCIGAHYSVRAWLKSLRQRTQLAKEEGTHPNTREPASPTTRAGRGEVRTTLVSVDAVRLGLTLSSIAGSTSSAASGLSRSPPRPTTARAESASGTGGAADSEGGTGNSSSAGAESDAGGKTLLERRRQGQEAQLLALDRLVQRCLWAVSRGEESVSDSYKWPVVSLALALPVPWGALVAKLLSARKR